MSEKRMLILPAHLVEKIDANKGDLSRGEFIDFLIENSLEQDVSKGHKHQYVTQEDLKGFELGIKGLLRSFLEFFISYGLEIGVQPGKDKFEELDQKLQGLGSSLGIREKG